MKRERRGITYERFTRGLYEIFFFFFSSGERAGATEVRMIDAVRPIRINVIGSTSRKGHGLDGVGI